MYIFASFSNTALNIMIQKVGAFYLFPYSVIALLPNYFSNPLSYYINLDPLVKPLLDIGTYECKN